MIINLASYSGIASNLANVSNDRMGKDFGFRSRYVGFSFALAFSSFSG